MNDLAEALPALPSRAVVDSEPALAEAAVSRERKRQRIIVKDVEAQGKKRLHPTIWDNMLPEDHQGVRRPGSILRKPL
jgi:hypothetical protein